MSVSSIIGGGIRLVRTQPRVVAIWGAAYFVMMAALIAVLYPAMASTMQLQQQVAANAAAGINAPPVFPGRLFATIFLFDLFFFLFILILFAAVVRAIVQPTGDRFAYLRIGMDELRLLGLGVILMIAGFLAEIIAMLLLVVIGMILSFIVGKAGAAIVAVILGLVLMGSAIYAEVRLSLAGAFTVMRQTIVIKEAWHATKGMFWTLFGAYLLMGLAFLVIGIVMIAVTEPQILIAYTSLNQQAINAAVQEQLARQAGGLSVTMVIQLVLGAVVGTVMIAIGFGAIATAALESQADR